jgi:multiple sugar transport system substrate-binding protein
MSHASRSSGRGLRFVLAASTAIAVLATAACGSDADGATGTGSDSAVKLTVMRNAPELTPEQVEEFESEHPTITLTVLDSDPTKLKSLQAAGNAPDVFRVQGPEVPQLVAQRQLLDLTERFDGSDLLAPDDLAPANDLYEIDGKRYGAVKDWSPDYTVFINNALFEQAGVPIPDADTSLSWQALGDLAKQVQAGIPGFDGVGIVGHNEFGVNRTIDAMLAEAGRSLYSDDGTSIELTDSPDAMEALAYHVDLAKTGATWSPLNPDPSWAATTS